MYSHTINEMADAISSGLGLDDAAKVMVRAILTDYWKDKIADVWNIDDVMDAADNAGVSLTEEEAIDILQLVHRRMDASIGINWDVIMAAIEHRG